MKKQIKWLLNTIVFIPNIPGTLILCGWAVYNIYKNTGWVEINMLNGKIPLTDDIKKYLLELYPKSTRIVIAVIFWANVAIITLMK